MKFKNEVCDFRRVGLSESSGFTGVLRTASLSVPERKFSKAPRRAFFALAVTLSFIVSQVASGLDVITTVAGTGVRGSSGDGGPATSAQLDNSADVAFDGAGNLFIADRTSFRVRKVDTSGIITTVAGTGTQAFGGDGGPATSARMNFVVGVAIDGAGNLFIADLLNHRIRKVDTSGIITTVAGSGAVGSGNGGFSGDGGPATSARLSYPRNIAIDGSGNLFIVDASNYRIRKVDTNGIITTVVGTGVSGSSGDGGPATSAQLNSPWDVAVDVAGNLFIADASNHSVRKVDTSGIITTVAGTGVIGDSGDGGPATSAQVSQPSGVAVDVAGNLFIADTGNHRIRKVDTSGIITTVAGNGMCCGFSGDGGPATSALLDLPRGIAFDGASNLFFADQGHHRIRKVFSSAVDPTPPTADIITPSTTGPTNATSVDFTVTFSEDVVNFNTFSAALVVINHIGTANTGVTITGGPQIYTVSVTGITGTGGFTLAVSTGLDIEDLDGNPLASSVTSSPVLIDNTAPTIEVDGQITDIPSPELTGTVSEATTSISVTVNGQTNLAVNNNDTTWKLKGDTFSALPAGVYDVSVTATDPAGNVGMDTMIGELAILASNEPLPEPMITTNINPNFVEEGSLLILTAPIGINYQWTKEGINLVEDPPRVTGTKAQNLTFNTTLESDLGTYTVFYENGAKAIVESDPFFLNVLPLGSLPVARAGALAVLIVSLIMVGIAVRRRTALTRKESGGL